MRTRALIIEDLKILVKSKGYIYALLMILSDDFHLNLQMLHEINHRDRLSFKEALLLLGFFIQNEIDLTIPDSPQEIILMKKETYSLLEELHKSFLDIFMERIKDIMEGTVKMGNFEEDTREFFGSGEMLIEPIFYSGPGIYDIQYTEFLDKKYKYDYDWLIKNKNFDSKIIIQIFNKLKEYQHKKSEKINYYSLQEKKFEIIQKAKEQFPDNPNIEEETQNYIDMLAFHQYVKFFFDENGEEELSLENIREEGWKSFYKGILDLFIIKKSDFSNIPCFESFLQNFSTASGNDVNVQFTEIGSYNILNSNPIIKLDDERYLLPLSFLLAESIYENPFYWMINDTEYKDKLCYHRGIIGEEITVEFLEKVFGKENVFAGVKVQRKKGVIETDIDVLCILGNKALCVQVKSKKLTELSKRGNTEKILKDFKEGIQCGYNQGLVSRKAILSKGVKLFLKDGSELILSEEIDDAYIMIVTTENYPALTHQTEILIEKSDSDPFPLVLSIFDLDLLSHYLSDSFDFLYYVRQRINLTGFFKAMEELVYLGYHLDQKLWRIPNVDHFAIDDDFGQIIDRNYYPMKLGIEIDDEGDAIKAKWKNEDFNTLCSQIKGIKEPKKTDIIFYLLDLSGETRINLVKTIRATKKRTIQDGKGHDFSIPPDGQEPNVGFTYVTIGSNDREELYVKLLGLSKARKYKSKADAWVGFGSLKDSPNMIDMVVFNNDSWKYDSNLKEIESIFISGKGREIRLGKKVGRNEKCHCGSHLKYKRCCGKK